MHETPLKKLGLDSSGEIVNSGYHRNDFLFKKNNEAIISELKEKYSIPKDKLL